MYSTAAIHLPALLARYHKAYPALNLQVHSARDVAGRAVFTFRQGCSYRMRLEAWYAHDHAAMGRVMEIESYPSMLAWA